MEAIGETTRIIVDGEAALAGVLGTIGQSVISKQAEKVTLQFATNLESAIAGKDIPKLETTKQTKNTRTESSCTPDMREPNDVPPTLNKITTRDPWVTFAALCSFGALVLSISILIYLVST